MYWVDSYAYGSLQSQDERMNTTFDHIDIVLYWSGMEVMREVLGHIF